MLHLEKNNLSGRIKKVNKKCLAPNEKPSPPSLSR